MHYWTPKQYGYYSTHRLNYDKPSFIVDITSYWDRKISAVKAYQSQIKNVSTNEALSLVEKVEVICRYFGQCAKVRYGEPFVSCEPMLIKELMQF